jgi:hypothetical protein
MRAIPFFDFAGLIANGLAVATLAYVWAVLAGTKLPFISTDRMAFIALAVVGMTICAIGGIGKAAAVGWTEPITIIGTVLGAAALLVIVSVFAGWLTDRTGIVILASVMAMKWLVGWGLAFLGR